MCVISAVINTIDINLYQYFLKYSKKNSHVCLK